MLLKHSIRYQNLWKALLKIMCYLCEKNGYWCCNYVAVKFQKHTHTLTASFTTYIIIHEKMPQI